LSGKGFVTAQMCDHGGKISGGEDLHVGDQGGRSGPTRRRDQRSTPRSARGEGHGEFTPDAAQAPVECEFADECDPLCRLGFDRATGDQDADGDGEIEPRAPLSQSGWGEVDGDSILGK